MIPLLAATTQQALSYALVGALVVGWLVYIVIHVRTGAEKPGDEAQFAPNRRPYFDDDAMEGPRLERALGWALVLLVIIAIGLPLYWLNEPSRQAGAFVKFDEQAAHRGYFLFQVDGTVKGGHNIGSFGCAGCHGDKGQGGSALYNLVDPKNPDALPRQVSWIAPALNTVLLRFTEDDKHDEVNRIITYGRPGTPMPAWGVEGGGPMNAQQITDLIEYLKSIQLTPKEAMAQAAKLGTDGKTLFEENCARCHTKGFSYGEPDVMGGGAFGPNLLDGVTIRQFPVKGDHVEFVTSGSDFEKQYGVRGIGSGRMPGFGKMLTKKQIEAIVDYERSL
jgi:mono/diheme cytochrome c family protein